MPATSFSTTDPDIYAFVELADVAVGDTVQVKWFNPDGFREQGQNSAYFIQTLVAGNTMRWCTSWLLTATADQASNLQYSPIAGRWAAELVHWPAGSNTNGVLRTVPVDILPAPVCSSYQLHPLAPPLFGHVTVETAHGCLWTPVPKESWIHITNVCRNTLHSGGVCDTRGSGNGYFTYETDPNETKVSRVGQITVANQIFTVTQTPSPGITALYPATGVSGPAVAGGMITIIGYDFCGSEPGVAALNGDWPPILGNIQVRVDNRAPLLLQYAGFNGTSCQVNAQLPWDLPPGNHTALPIYRGFTVGVVAPFTTTLVNPSFYAAPPRYPVLLQIADRGYSIMTSVNPVYPGETLVGYPDGFGQTNPPRIYGAPFLLPAGQFATVSAPVEAWLKSCLASVCSITTAKVLYAIAYPASPAGYQVAVTLPQTTVDPAKQYSLVVRVDGNFAPDLALYLSTKP
ncbi:MAG: hypothetical protein ABI811_06710 [Acidobacteriota bacterium]